MPKERLAGVKIEFGDSRPGLTLDHKPDAEEWLDVGDWLAAGEPFAFSLGVPRPLLREPRGHDDSRNAFESW